MWLVNRFELKNQNIEFIEVLIFTSSMLTYIYMCVEIRYSTRPNPTCKLKLATVTQVLMAQGFFSMEITRNRTLLTKDQTIEC